MPGVVVTVLAWAAIARADESATFRDLFNGRDFTGWSIEGPTGGIEHPDGKPVWSVRDGEIICNGRSWSFLRYDREEFSDFTLHVEFIMAEKANSGVGFRCRAVDMARVQETRPSCWAYEIQLLEDAGEPPTVHSSGSLYRYVAPRENAMRPAGEWNVLEVTCRGPRIQCRAQWPGNPGLRPDDAPRNTRQAAHRGRSVCKTTATPCGFATCGFVSRTTGRAGRMIAGRIIDGTGALPRGGVSGMGFQR
jgi:hypothetical protein